MTEPATIAEYQNASQRLKHAVHRHKAVSKEGLTERLFTLLFTGLVYPQIWEDPEVDLQAMALTPGLEMGAREWRSFRQYQSPHRRCDP